MWLITGIWCLLLYFMSIKISSNKLNPLSFYMIWWFLIVSFAALRLRGEPFGSFQTYVMIIIGASSFFAGYIFIYSNYLSNNCLKKILKKIRYIDLEIRKPVIYAILLFTLLYMLVLWGRVSNYVKMGYPSGLIRQKYWNVGEGIINSAFEYFIAHEVIDTIILLSNCIFAIKLVQGKLDKIFTILFLGITALNTYTTEGRMNLVDVILCCVFTYCLLRKRIYISLKIKRRIFFIAIIVVIAVINITILRQTSKNLITTIWSQYTMNIPFMSYLLGKLGSTQDITYGYVYFGGVMSLIFVVLSRFGIGYPSVDGLLGKYINPFYTFGNGLTANAYTSHLFYFYLDGRWIGVILGSMVFGMIASTIYMQYIRKQDTIALIRLLIILNVIYYTFFQWKFVNASYVSAIFLVPFLFKKRKYKKNDIQVEGVTRK